MIELLLACESLRTVASRELILRRLPSQVEALIPRLEAPKRAIDSIVAHCIERDALEQLLDAVRYFEEGSRERRALDAWVDARDLKELAGHPECPFMGFASFTTDDEQWFFGREQEVRDALAKKSLGSSRWLQVEGPSGVGKSSFVYAGIIPAARSGGLPGSPRIKMVIDVRPGRRPLHYLAGALAVGFGGRAGTTSELKARLAKGEGELADLIAEQGQKRKKGQVILVVDQLEEVITLSAPMSAESQSGDSAADADDEVRRFEALLCGALREPRCPLWLVTTVRSDLIGEVHRRMPELGRLLNGARRYVLSAMDADNLSRAVTEPAERAGLHWSDRELPVDIVADVLAQPAQLVLLSESLRRMWEHRDLGTGTLLRSAYRKPAEAVADGADGALAGFGKSELGAARAMLLAMVQTNPGARDVRRTLTRQEVLAVAADAGLSATRTDTVYGRLSGQWDEAAQPSRPPALLVARGTDGDEVRVDLVHEELMRVWPRFKAWIDKDRARLNKRDAFEAMAMVWERAGKQAIADPAALREYRDVEPVTAIGRAYLQAAGTPGYRRWLKWMTAILALAGVAWLINYCVRRDAAIDALTVSAEIETQRDFHANAALLTAESARLTVIGDKRRRRANLLAHLELLPAPLREIPWQLPARVSDLALSPDGKLLAVATPEGECSLYRNDVSGGWDKAGLTLIRSFSDCSEYFSRHLSFDWSGTHLFYGATDSAGGSMPHLRAMSVENGRAWPLSSRGVGRLVPSPEYEFLVLSGTTRLFQLNWRESDLWHDLPTVNGFRCKEREGESFWLKDGTLVFGCSGQGVVYYEPNTNRAELVFAPELEQLLAASPDGRLVVDTLSADGLYVRSGSELLRIRALPDTYSAAFSSDSRLVALQGPEGLTIVDTASQRTRAAYTMAKGWRPRFAPGDEELLLLPWTRRSTAKGRVRSPLVVAAPAVPERSRFGPRPSVAFVDGTLTYDGASVTDLRSAMAALEQCRGDDFSWDIDFLELRPGRPIVAMASMNSYRSQCRSSALVVAWREAARFRAHTVPDCGLRGAKSEWNQEGTRGYVTCRVAEATAIHVFDKQEPIRVVTLAGMVQIVRSGGVDEPLFAVQFLEESDRAQVQLHRFTAQELFSVNGQAEVRRMGEAGPLRCRRTSSSSYSFPNVWIRSGFMASLCGRQFTIWDTESGERLWTRKIAASSRWPSSLSQTGEYALVNDKIWDWRNGRILFLDGQLFIEKLGAFKRFYNVGLEMYKWTEPRIIRQLERDYRIRIEDTKVVPADERR